MRWRPRSVQPAATHGPAPQETVEAVMYVAALISKLMSLQGETLAGRGVAELQALFHISMVRRILEELNASPEFQRPQKLKDNNSLMADTWD